PNPLKLKARGTAVIVVPIVPFCDDVSANKSKRYGPHESWYFQLAGWPFQQQQETFNIQFICTSNTMNGLTGVDMGDALADELTRLADGVLAWDSSRHEEVLVIAPVLAIVGD
ncbi:uncharacterized protein EV422DRAFT_481817, partial [Fimicolochytrium jonesii]|uniref:uncharacterized protein n=1 Tax=Fimicolochytrium jonesii TaxID=1396493 RepID=UPI0022FDE7DE